MTAIKRKSNSTLLKWAWLLLILFLFCISSQTSNSITKKEEHSLILSCENSVTGMDRKAVKEGNKVKTVFPKVQIRGTEVRRLKSEYLNREFEIDISFPKGYHNETSRYPVVYVLDAEYNFGCVSYITRRLIKNKEIPKVLVVGIAYDTTYENFYRFRMRDLSPKFPNQKEGGRADKFALFLEKELFPFVNRNYRSNHRDRTLAGHSMGGLFGLYVLFNNPHLFNRIICVSPSIWYCKKMLYKYKEEYTKNSFKPKVRIYTAVGARETDHMIQDWKLLFSRLKEKEYQNLSIKARLMEDETHRSIFPYAFTKGLKFIFAVTPE